MSLSKPDKKTIYLDVDEEITNIIDKVRMTNESIIALVLPKRATMLQSIVNMKLLKRAADSDSKKVVLITTESTLLPLAGLAGLHVAANLQSRPYIPAPPDTASTAPESNEITSDEDVPIDPQTPVGALMDKETDDSPIEIDNRPKPEDAATPATAAAAAKKAKSKGKKKLSVPSFNKFRKKMLIGGLAALLLLIFLLWALIVAPKATVTIKGDTNSIPLNVEFTADTEADNFDEERGIVPAKSVDAKKTGSEKVPATGQKDKGTKAGGTMTFKNCSDDPVTIPAGTGVSSGSQTFITQSSVRLDDGEFSSSGTCRNSGDHVGNTNVIAQSNGDQYNLSPRSYTVSNFSKVTAQGGQMSGGTSNVVKVVTAGDIDSARQKLSSDQNQNKEELKKQLEGDDYVAIEETFAENKPQYTPNPAVGSEANEVTVSYEVTFTMLGVKEDDLKKIVNKVAKKQVDTSKQSILSDGLEDATFKVGEKEDTTTELVMDTRIIAGPEVDREGIKREISGKKRGEAEQLLGSKAGFKEVRIDTKPFWNYSVPKKASKIKIVVEQSDGSKINP